MVSGGPTSFDADGVTVEIPVYPSPHAWMDHHDGRNVLIYGEAHYGAVDIARDYLGRAIAGGRRALIIALSGWSTVARAAGARVVRFMPDEGSAARTKTGLLAEEDAAPPGAVAAAGTDRVLFWDLSAYLQGWGADKQGVLALASALAAALPGTAPDRGAPRLIVVDAGARWAPEADFSLTHLMRAAREAGDEVMAILSPGAARESVRALVPHASTHVLTRMRAPLARYYWEWVLDEPASRARMSQVTGQLRHRGSRHSEFLFRTPDNRFALASAPYFRRFDG